MAHMLNLSPNINILGSIPTTYMLNLESPKRQYLARGLILGLHGHTQGPNISILGLF